MTAETDKAALREGQRQAAKFVDTICMDRGWDFRDPIINAFAPVLAQAEADRAEIEALKLDVMLNEKPVFSRREIMAQRDAAEARADRLAAEVEALRAEQDEVRSHLPEALRDAGLAGAVQALAFSAQSENDSKWRWGHALQIGIAFADKAAGEEWEHGGMASVDACYAMATILGCECGDKEWTEMAKAGAARLAARKALARAADKPGERTDG